MNLVKSVTTVGKPGYQVIAISKREDGFYIIVVEPGNGKKYPPPSINSTPIGNQATKLNKNDVVEIAGVKLLFSYN